MYSHARTEWVMGHNADLQVGLCHESPKPASVPYTYQKDLYLDFKL